MECYQCYAMPWNASQLSAPYTHLETLVLRLQSFVFENDRVIRLQLYNFIFITIHI